MLLEYPDYFHEVVESGTIYLSTNTFQGPADASNGFNWGDDIAFSRSATSTEGHPEYFT